MNSSETYTGVSNEQFQEFASTPIEGAFQMLNLLKFKDIIEETGKSGEEGYHNYMKAVMPFFQASNAKLIYQGKPLFSLIGPEEKEWDKVLIIEYPSKADFIKMITAEGYPAAMRRQALADSRLILCKS